MTDILERAENFAKRAHLGHVRFNKAQEPYVNHLAEVASLVNASGGSKEEIAAAWLHDAVEDTPTTLSQIREEFGSSVAEIVDGLTDPLEFSGMPMNERKVLQARRVHNKSDGVKRVKISDQISNVRCVFVDPPVKWDDRKCLIYTETAFLIAMECGHISMFLNAEFRKAYNNAVRKYNIPAD